MKMYDNVLQRVRILERKNGIIYADTDGSLYKTSRLILVIGFIYSIVINTLYLMSILIRNLDLSKFFVTPAICTGLLIAGFVLMLFKKHIIGAPLTTVPSVVAVVFFRPLLEGEYVGTVQARFYWGHLAPAVLLIIAASVMAFVGIRAHLKLKKMYNRVVENIYNTYKVNVNGGEDIAEEQWEEFLKKFDPYNYNEQFMSIEKEEDSE